MKRTTISLRQWNEYGTRKYGTDRSKWMFVCPNCDRRQSLEMLSKQFPEVDRCMFFVGQSCGYRYSNMSDMCNHSHFCHDNPLLVVFPDGTSYSMMDFDDSILSELLSSEELIGFLTGHNWKEGNKNA